MAHFRARTLEAIIRRDLKWSRIVSVLGMRQSGKTTLIRKIVPHYVSLDDEIVISEFRRGEWELIDLATETLAIDEAQTLPSLFSRLKLKVDDSNRPGQFLLTGSVRFLSRRQIRESLTGRTSILELLPMTIAECHNRKLNDFINLTLDLNFKALAKQLEKRAWAKQSDINRYLKLGGMPGVCFKRDETTRNKIWSAHLDTVLSRDVRQIYDTNLSTNYLVDIFRHISRAQGMPHVDSQLSRMVGVSNPTIKKVLRVFEDLFLIRRHGNMYYCEDHGLSTHIAGAYIFSERQELLRFVFSELLGQLKYLHSPGYEFQSYKTRGGADVPFVIEFPKQGCVGITIDQGTGASEKSLKSLASFGRRKPQAKKIVIHRGNQLYETKSGVICVPWNLIC